MSSPVGTARARSGLAPTLPPFPPLFRFGVATADHQCEAYVPGQDDVRDEWERVRGLQRRLRATDFWTRYPEDVQLAASLGCKAFRVSLSWARLEPAPGSWDAAVERHYAQLLNTIRDAGMKAIVTLHHNTWPLHVQNLSGGDGMLSDTFPDVFAKYAGRVATSFGNLVDYYLTINEPNQLIYGYIKGFWMRAYPMPPGLDPFAPEVEQMQRVIRLIPNLFRAHARARSAIRAVEPKAMVGSNPLILGVPKWLRAFIDWQATRVKRPEDLLKQAHWLSQTFLVASGEVDFSIAQLTMTQSRMDKVLFSEPYFIGHLVALHRAEATLPESFVSWEGNVGVTQETAPAAMAERVFPDAAITEYENTAKAVEALRNAEVDVVFDDDVMLRQFSRGLEMTALSAPDQPFAIATALGSRSLLNAIDLALRRFKFDSSGASLWQEAIAADFPGLAKAGAPDLQNRKTLAHLGRTGAMLPSPSDVPGMDRSLDLVKRRGHVRVGVHSGVDGLCTRNSNGLYEGLEPTIARYVASQIVGKETDVEFVALDGDRRLDAARSWLSFFDRPRKLLSLTLSFVGADWWNLGMAGHLAEFLCPAECVGTLDFVGLDYYWGADSLWQAPRLLPAMECRYGDAPVWPQGLYNLLREESRRFPGKPLLIIENGCVPVADGVSCADYLTAHVREAQRALADGIPLEAYVCWSITSNREWGLVFDHNSDFGLYHIDLDHDDALKRAATDASARYAQIIKTRSV
ncbi:MAG TPA: family 1 glycosylhydrolase [Candidatus Acidoferrales bacterium]|nr:family 1 glycosylhydrolase [Candidatus Acidoferrales bacterium]